MENYVEWIGIIAGLCTTFSFLPQIAQIWKTKSASSISLPMYIIFSIGIILWLVYGVMLNAPALIFANSLTLLFSMSILIMKLMWK